MGRPRKPTALKLLRGDHKERINGSEPASPSGLGAPPAWLDEIATSAWRRLAVVLDEMRVATRADAELVSIYCQNYSVWRRAWDLVAERGLAVDSQTWERAHPMIGVANQAQAQMVKILSQLGMSPSARAGLHVGSGPKEDRLGALLARKPPVPDGKSTKAR